MAHYAVLEDELRLLEVLSYIMVLMGVITFILLRFIQVPYGRYSSSTFGPLVPVRLAWFVQELPSLAVPVYYLTVHREVAAPSRALLVAFICHYVQRTLIFPFLIRGGKPTPLASFLLAFIFCCYNGYLQSSYLCQYAQLPDNWIYDPRFIIGIALFIFGMLINIHSDRILRNLRKPGETGYKIPIDEFRSDEEIQKFYLMLTDGWSELDNIGVTIQLSDECFKVDHRTVPFKNDVVNVPSPQNQACTQLGWTLRICFWGKLFW
ncbi:3-oxo-5-alpha-steroid 4-dehydrogenase 1 isoform X2 [Dendropsophus ebraccatus]|uniref:3-oxo-5-alpha-steroid 4-dehydrogenase 1 isoform X2 n=1 Tax=Dendropsophus ebraccatus TaxID=150705 RepID=UPI003831837F